MQCLYEQARLATWFNTKISDNKPVVSMWKMLAEAELANKKVQAGPYGTESTFTAPSLNIFIKIAKQYLLQADAEPMITQATALTFAYLLSNKTESTADTYVTNLASERNMPVLALQC